MIRRLNLILLSYYADALRLSVRAMCIPCPFVYANGKTCTGHIERVEAYKADITWTPNTEGRWRAASSRHLGETNEMVKMIQTRADPADQGSGMGQSSAFVDRLSSVRSAPEAAIRPSL
jgi:hypothetical protein